jgi:hypothetical protein
MNKNRRYRDTVATITLPDGTIKTKLLPSFKETGQMLLTFALAVFGWIIFRAENIAEIGLLVSNIFNAEMLFVLPIKKKLLLSCICYILLMLVVEWINRTNSHGLVMNIKNKWLRYIVYYVLIIMIFFNFGQEQSFIYFQF